MRKEFFLRTRTKWARYAPSHQHEPASPGAIAIRGITRSDTPPPSENRLVRVEQALPIETPASTPLPTPAKATKPTPAGKAGKTAKGQKPIAQSERNTHTSRKNNQSGSHVIDDARAKIGGIKSCAQSQCARSAFRRRHRAGGGNWKTYPPGKMPIGRLIAAADLGAVADYGLTGKRAYPKGQFVGCFSLAEIPVGSCGISVRLRSAQTGFRSWAATKFAPLRLPKYANRRTVSQTSSRVKSCSRRNPPNWEGQLRSRPFKNKRATSQSLQHLIAPVDDHLTVANLDCVVPQSGTVLSEIISQRAAIIFPIEHV